MSLSDSRTDRAAALRSDTFEVVAGRRIPDPYRWLEDASDPRTASWLAGQQRLFRRARKQWLGRDRFLRRLYQLTAFEECTAPVWRGLRAFYACRGPDDEHPALRTRRYTSAGAPSGSERTVVDPVALDPAGRTTLNAWVPSQDGHLVACLLSADGTEQAVLRVLDVESGAFVGAAIEGSRLSSVAWLPGRAAFYYVADHPGDGGPRVWLHQADRQAGPDREVFGAGLGEVSELDIVLDQAGRDLLVTAVTDFSSGTEIWLAQCQRGGVLTGYRIAACPDGWSAVWPGNDGLLYLLTDDQAPRGRIVVVDAGLARTDPGRTLVAEAEAGVLESFAILDGGPLAGRELLVARSQSGHSTLSCHDLRTGRWLRDIPLPGTGIVADLSCRPEGGREAWFSYSDTLTPPTIYRYDARSHELLPWRQVPAAGPRAVRAMQLHYPAAGGAQVRLLLTMPAEASGPLPTIVHAYGAFGESQQIEYYELGLAWAEAGGILAVACVRGGGEEGEAWHQAGMRASKQQGIDDLIAAVDYLVGTGLAAPNAIGVKGFSAGGLLAAAAFTQRPALFAAAECTSPLLDMARYQLSGLGRLWTSEFGSRDNPDELDWLLGYSPYHNVTSGTAYPAVLLATFDGDTRVDPLHARKMCAALQHATGSGRPVLLRTEQGVGHGDRSRSARLGYFADVLAFFAHHLTTPGGGRRAPEESREKGGVRT